MARQKRSAARHQDHGREYRPQIPSGRPSGPLLKTALYIDTSAYLSLLLKRDSWKAVQKIMRGGRYFSSSLLFLESHRNLLRLVREKQIRNTEYDLLFDKVLTDRELFTIKHVDFDICLSHIFPAVSLPRSQDLAHIRTAFWFQKQEPKITFVTLDTDQRRSAHELGLEVAKIERETS